MYSGLAQGVTHALGYDQVARTAACMIHGMLEAEAAKDCAAHLVALYPEDSRLIDPARYTYDHLHVRIAVRVEGYLAAREYGTPEARFFSEWEAVLPRIEVAFVTWEQVVAAVGDPALGRFYGLCRRFNGKGASTRGVMPA